MESAFSSLTNSSYTSTLNKPSPHPSPNIRLDILSTVTLFPEIAFCFVRVFAEVKLLMKKTLCNQETFQMARHESMRKKKKKKMAFRKTVTFSGRQESITSLRE